MRIGSIIMRRLLMIAVIYLSFSVIDAEDSQINNDTRIIPEIQYGQPCVKGRMYKMDCNTCHCGANAALLCTKMACFDPHQFQKTHPKILREDKSACTPGKIYKKKCRKCYCTDKKGLQCGRESCKNFDRNHTEPDDIRMYSAPEFYHLPALPHQGVECQPGVTYRIDCNTCLCLANGNLLCQDLLCPSYEDVYRIRAKEMTGRQCEKNIDDECFKCKCVTGKYECSPTPLCKHADGRRMLHGEFPSEDDRNFIKADQVVENCEPGMVYKVHCNKCYCQDDKSLRCTQKTCLNFAEVQKLKKLKQKSSADGKE